MSHTVLYALDDTSAQTDITQVGMNLFTTAYKWESSSASGYTKQALQGFSKKLNAAIKRDSTLSSLYTTCGWCSEVVKPGLDDALLTYLRDTPPRTTNGGNAYFAVVVPFLDAKVSSTMTADSTSALDRLVSTMVDSITTQTKEQMDWFRDVSGMGLYYDGDTTNSPYDLMDDVRRIDAIFFRETPDKWTYKNTTKNDSSALITGRVQQGSWAGGKNYNLDLASEITGALSGNSGSGSSNSSWNQTSGNCQSGFCVTVDFVKSSHYLLGGSSTAKKGDNSLQWLFESGLEWFTKNGDKRNFACKGPPSNFLFQPESDRNLKFSKIFSGLSIFVFWKTPKFMSGFFNRNTAANAADQKKQDDQKTEDSLRLAFKRHGLDYDHPTNLKASKLRTLQDVALKYSAENSTVGNVADSLSQAKNVYQQILLQDWAGSQRAYVHEQVQDSIKHMEKTFDETSSRIRTLAQLNEDLSKVLAYIKDKPKCWNN